MVVLIAAQTSLANEFKATQQRLSETYLYDFMDLREQYQLTRFKLRGINSLNIDCFALHLRYYPLFLRRCVLSGYMSDIIP